MKAKNLTRRRAVQVGAAAAALPLVHIRTAGAAGKLNISLWDHWVPGGTEAMRKQVKAWADKNKVEVADDYTSQGTKLQMNAAAESQAKAGHDFVPLLQWDTIAYADNLEPVDDVIKYLGGKYGTYDPVVEYLAKFKGHWVAIPGSDPTANLACCARISMLKQYAGIDIQAMYPNKPSDPKLSEGWTYDVFLKAMEACHKAGFPFGLGLGSTGDSVNNTGAIFSAYGADLVNAKGEITVNSDGSHCVID